MTKVLVLLIVILFAGCTKDNEEEKVKEVENSSPQIASLIFPSNNMSCINSDVEFRWEKAVDLENDPITYRLLISKHPEFSNENITIETNQNIMEIPLEPGVIYYWKLKAYDIKENESKFSPIVKFYTQGDSPVNTLPYLAENIYPLHNVEISPVSEKVMLQWKGSDPNMDSLTYDIYFGKYENPTLFKVNIEVENFEVNIEKNTVYYWQILTSDKYGGKSFSVIWKFKVTN